MTFNDEIDRALERAQKVEAEAAARRANLRRKTERQSGARRKTIAHTIQAIDGTMKILRSLIGRLPYHDTTEGRTESLYEVSSLLQYHRRQLKKMAA